MNDKFVNVTIVLGKIKTISKQKCEDGVINCNEINWAYEARAQDGLRYITIGLKSGFHVNVLMTFEEFKKCLCVI